MVLIDGMHHLAFVTTDMDRLLHFYQRVFDAQVIMDMDEDGLRHTFIALGPTTVLHPFQIPGVEAPAPGQPMFARGRLDHFAVSAASEDAFWEMRERIVVDGAGDGRVIDMGSLLSVAFTDPDGGEHEVVWPKPDVPVSASLPRGQWRDLTERPA